MGIGYCGWHFFPTSLVKPRVSDLGIYIVVGISSQISLAKPQLIKVSLIWGLAIVVGYFTAHKVLQFYPNQTLQPLEDR